MGEQAISNMEIRDCLEPGLKLVRNFMFANSENETRSF